MVVDTITIYDTVMAPDGFNVIKEVVKKSCLLDSRLDEVDLYDLPGIEVNTQEWLGKYKVVTFWFIECKPCIKEIPVLDRLQKKYTKKDIDFFAVNFINDRKKVSEFNKKYPLDFDYYCSNDSLVISKFGLLWGYPMTMVLDENNILKGIFENLHDAKEYEKFTELVDKI